MGPIRQGPRDRTPQTRVCGFVFLWTSFCLSRIDSTFYLELIKFWKKTEWSLFNKQIRQCHPIPTPFPLKPHPRSLNYIPSNLVCPWNLIHPFQTRLYVDHFSSKSNIDSSCSSRFPFHPRLPRNTLHSWWKIHSDRLSSNFNFDTFLPLADFSHPSILGRPFCSFLQVIPRDDHSF